MSKRIGLRGIAALLAAALVFTAVPVSANAAEAVDVAEVVGTAEVVDGASGEVLEEESGENRTEAAEEVSEEKNRGKDDSSYDKEEQTPKGEEGSEYETGQTEDRTETEAVGEDETGASENSEEMTETDTADDSVTTDESTEEATEDLAEESNSETKIEEGTTACGLIVAQAIYKSEFDRKLSEIRATFRDGSTWDERYNRGWQCFGYAHWAANYVFGSSAGDSFNWTKVYNMNSVKAGDIIQYGDPSNGYGHTIFVTAVSGNTITYTDANSDYKNTVKWDQTITKNVKLYGYSFSYVKSSPGTEPDPIPDRVKGTYMDTGYSRVIPDGDYHIVSSQGDNWWLTNSGFSMDDGGNVNIWDYVNIDMECIDHVYNFKFIDGGDGRGFYKITNKLSGKCLDVNGASEYLYEENGNRTNVQQWEDNGSPAQQWAVNGINGGDKGMLYTLQARCSSYYLDVEGGNASCGSNIGVWTTGIDSAQQWRLVPYAPTVGQTIKDGEYQIVYSTAENKVAGVAENISGANIELSSSYKGDYRQTVDVKYLENGYYSIINKDSGLSWDVANYSRELGTNIQLCKYVENDAQKWIIQPCGNGSYNIISKCNGLYLHLDGIDAADRANVNMWSWGTDNTIKWKFVPYIQSKLPTPTSTLSNSAEVDAGTKFYLNKNGADTIYFTWDGTTPTKQSTKYSDSTGLTIPTGQTTCTLKAFGVKEGYQDSDVLEITYTVKQKTPSGEEGDPTGEDTSNPEDDDPQDGVKWHYNEQNVAYKDLSQYGQIVTTINPKTYDGTPYKPIVKVTATENGKTVTLTEGPDYRVLYYNNIHAGTGSVTIKGNGVYKGTISRKFEIKKKSCKKLKVVANSMLTGDSRTPEIYVYDGNVLLKENKDYTLDGITPNLTATKGTKQIYVMAAGDSDYEGMISAKITVYDADKGRIKGIIDRPEKVKLSQSIYQYTGKACKPTAVVTVDGKILTAGKDYTIKYQNNKDVGTAFATIKGKGSYVGSVVKEFTIKPSSGEFTLKKAISAVTYNGKLQKPKTIIKVNGKTLKLNKDYTLSYSNNLHATDRAKVTVRGKGNYADVPAKTFYFTINPCHIKKASVKGGQGSLLITHARHTLVEGVDYDVIYGPAVGKGKISVTIKAKEGSSFTGEVTKKVKQ